ncbi:hypothetical protein GGR57DRAFT_512633 [Xylariaceae sp. FL1272]|nr:hypothetical protein GGR57DRAFT_512633 [Xylariaceae sp. FL1272]
MVRCVNFNFTLRSCHANTAWPAWDCRDQQDQAELYYNQPLRLKNRRLEDENMALKKLLREHNLSWQGQSKRPASPEPSSRVTRSRRSHGPQGMLPYLPIEIQLKILSCLYTPSRRSGLIRAMPRITLPANNHYIDILVVALTSPHPVVDPLGKLKPERVLAREKAKKSHDLAIHFLTTCRAYHVEGTKFLWSNNTFVFTSPTSLRNFAEVDLVWRHQVKHVTLRLVAKFYDDEDRSHRLPRSYHPDLKKPVSLLVQRRIKENTLARRGFRAYAWLQLIDFLEAMLPPYDPKSTALSVRPRLLPSLSSLRIDFVNFTDNLLQYPPHQLHDLASHQLGCMLNELILTGIPTDECGMRVSTELSGLLKDEGLLIDHAPTMLADKKGIRPLQCNDEECHYTSKVIRGMHNSNFYLHDHHRDEVQFDPAPTDEGEPPFSPFHSCRTIWKRVPVCIDKDERKWELFDRVSGMPWEDIEEDATMFDFLDDDDDGMVCENCGEVHPGAILPDELMDLYDDF